MKWTAGFACLFLTAAAQGGSLTVLFDFSRSEIGLDVVVGKTPLYMILDTGVDPSVIDTKRAEALGLKIDRNAGGEASGEGNAASAKVYPTAITGLGIAGRDFPAVEALAADLGGLSAHYGRALDGVLGYSFLKDKVVLVDYGHTRLLLLAHPADAVNDIKLCRKHFTIPLTSLKDDNTPLIPEFRFGAVTGPISLDTGSSGAISLFPKALEAPGFKNMLTEKGETTYAGARGDGKAKTYVLNAPVGFGPFKLPPGQIVSLQAPQPDPRLANIGNKLYAAMKLKMLLDYRARLMTFYGDCR